MPNPLKQGPFTNGWFTDYMKFKAGSYLTGGTDKAGTFMLLIEKYHFEYPAKINWKLWKQSRQQCLK